MIIMKHCRSKFHNSIISNAVDAEWIFCNDGLDRFTIACLYHYHTTDTGSLRTGCDEVPGCVMPDKIVAMRLKETVNLFKRFLVCQNCYKHT